MRRQAADTGDGSAKTRRKKQRSRDDEVQVSGGGEVAHRAVRHGGGPVRRHHIIPLAALVSGEKGRCVVGGRRRRQAVPPGCCWHLRSIRLGMYDKRSLCHRTVGPSTQCAALPLLRQAGRSAGALSPRCPPPAAWRRLNSRLRGRCRSWGSGACKCTCARLPGAQRAMQAVPMAPMAIDRTPRGVVSRPATLAVLTPVLSSLRPTHKAPTFCNSITPLFGYSGSCRAFLGSLQVPRLRNSVLECRLRSSVHERL